MTPEYPVAVRAIIVNDAGEVLFGRRVKNPCQGKLSLFGGKPEPEEKIGDAIVREVLEETELRVVSHELAKTHLDSSTTPEQPWVVHTYRCKVTGILELKADEHSEAVWLSRSDVAKSEQIAFDHKELVLKLVD